MGQWWEQTETQRAVRILETIDAHQWQRLAQLAERHQDGRLSSSAWETVVASVIDTAAIKADEQVLTSTRQQKGMSE